MISTKTHFEILKYRNKTPLINDNDHHRSDYLVHFSSILIRFLLCEAPCVKLLPNLQRLQIMWGGQFWTGPEVSAPKARWGPVVSQRMPKVCLPIRSVVGDGYTVMMYYDLLDDYIYIYMSSTAQGGGGSFKNRKPIGEVGCCESGMAERSHWWIERCLISLSLSFSFCLYIYLSIDRSLSIYVSMYLCIYLSIHPSIYLSIYLSI